MFDADKLKEFVRIARGRSKFQQALLELTNESPDDANWLWKSKPSPITASQPKPGRWRKAGRNGRQVWTPPS